MCFQSCGSAVLSEADRGSRVTQKITGFHTKEGKVLICRVENKKIELEFLGYKKAATSQADLWVNINVFAEMKLSFSCI